MDPKRWRLDCPDIAPNIATYRRKRQYRPIGYAKSHAISVVVWPAGSVVLKRHFWVAFSR